MRDGTEAFDNSKVIKIFPNSHHVEGNTVVVANSHDDHGTDGYYFFVFLKGQIIAPEDMSFIETVVRMAKVRIHNLLMLETIINLNSSLEQQVAEQTRDIRSMLENTKIGLLSITKNLTIHKNYAKCLETILEQPELSNKSIDEILLKNAGLGPDASARIITALEYSLGEDEIFFTANSACFPREIKAIFSSGVIKILDLDWSPVIDINGNIDKILVSIRDITETLDLRKEAEHGRRSLKFLAEVLEAGPKKYLNFDRHVAEMLASFSLYLDTSVEKVDEENIKRIFIALHTLKGMSRMYKFTEMTDIFHSAEELVQKNKTLKAKSLDEFRNQVSLMKVLKSEYYEAFKPLLAIKQQLEKLRFEQNPFDIYDLINDMASVGDQLAKELGKGGCHIVVELPDHLIIDEKFYEAFSKSLIHLVRNSIDHSIETPFERKKLGKPEWGEIYIRLAENGSLIFFDDGRGMNLAKIREKSIAMGKIYSSQEELVEIIFESGFSTCERVTEISGRGIGMNAVRTLLNEAGSSIKIIPQEIVGDHMKFHYAISFPHNIDNKYLNAI